MKTTIYPANMRGHNNIGWLNAYHSFSFGGYYNPENMHFGALRVLNDDTIAPGKGFGAHPHDNMEIITIVLSGAVAHQDSMGNNGIIRAGEVQVMSAGSGVKHSEYNASKDEELKLLQIWLFPKYENLTPRYDQRRFLDAQPNTLVTLIAPEKDGDHLWINQDALFTMGNFEVDEQVSYEIKIPGNGAYLFVIEGAIQINGTVLNKRDAFAVDDTSSFLIDTKATSRFLIIEVPMI